MEGDSLKAWQAKRMLDKLRPTLGYLCRLRERMEKVGFPPDDRLYQLVCQAYGSLHSLCVDLHYRSVKHGVGKPSEDE